MPVWLTPAGGREEACILGVPCVTLRDNTKRPETLDVGANALAGADAHQMMEKAKLMMGRENGWKNPFGDGRARAYSNIYAFIDKTKYKER